jgi:RNA-binding protein YhbY
MNKLTTKMKRYIKHKLKDEGPTIWIGKDGVTLQLLKEVEKQLEKKKMIKMKILKTALQNDKVYHALLQKKTEHRTFSELKTFASCSTGLINMLRISSTEGKNESMSDILALMVDFFLSKSEIILLVLLACLTGSAAWFFPSAQRYAILTVEDAQSLWQIYKRESRCNARRWRKTMCKNRVTGFECGCRSAQ